jgi:hypothetical protein
MYVVGLDSYVPSKATKESRMRHGMDWKRTLATRGITGVALAVGLIACSAAPAPAPEETAADGTALSTASTPIKWWPPINFCFPPAAGPADHPGQTCSPLNQGCSVQAFWPTADEGALLSAPYNCKTWPSTLRLPPFGTHEKFVLCPNTQDVANWVCAHSGSAASGPRHAHSSTVACDTCLPQAAADEVYVFWDLIEVIPNCHGTCPEPDPVVW